MWKFTGSADGTGYPGLPFEDMTDEEMATAEREVEPRFVETHGRIRDAKLWRLVKDNSTPPPVEDSGPPAAPSTDAAG